MIEIPTDLPAEVVPLAWLIGDWEGTGVIDYEADGEHFSGEFSHRVSFRHEGGAYLVYSATASMLGDDPRPLTSETGYWRLAVPGEAADAGPGLLPATATREPRTAEDIEKLRNDDDAFDLEAVIAHSDGVSEVYVGQIAGPRIDLATDAVARTASAKPYTAATRMYGLVDQHLLWAWDIAALGGELASHASARLAKEE